MSSLTVTDIRPFELILLDIGGLEDIISSVRETVIYPLIYPDLFRSASSGSSIDLANVLEA